MSRPVVTAMLLDDLLRVGAEIVLQKGSLITPAARDWLKEHTVPVTWLEPTEDKSASLAAVMDPTLPEMRTMRPLLERIAGAVEVIEPAPGRDGAALAMRQLCGMIRRREVAKGVVFAQDGAVPACVANKHAGVRAALGANTAMVEEACRELGINVLVIEYPTQTPFQMKEMIARLMAAPAAARKEVAAMIETIEQGDGRADG